jgi:aminodeoxyfutalosine deaminase
MIVRARIVVPVSRPPVEDGAVVISNGRIEAVGRFSAVRPGADGPLVDLGDAALLPGLINAHCHLDYTGMAGVIPRPTSFAGWIGTIIDLKTSWTQARYAASWREGAAMLLRNGVTTVVDVESVPALIPELWSATPLRVISLRELISLQSGPEMERVVQTAVAEWERLGGADERAGLSPHATYSTTKPLLELAARAARERGWPLATHVAESGEEFEMFCAARGPFFERFKEERDVSDCGRGSPVRHLEEAGYLGKDLMAVHVNYLGAGDAALLARRQVSVVHCPSSHRYFEHQPFPRAELQRAGVNLCLGTDSLASTAPLEGRPLELNLFSEMKAFATCFPKVPPEEVLRLCTLNAARALRREEQIGELCPGSHADMIALPFSGNTACLHEEIVHGNSPVSASMIAGNWVIEPELIR